MAMEEAKLMHGVDTIEPEMEGPLILGVPKSQVEGLQETYCSQKE